MRLPWIAPLVLFLSLLLGSCAALGLGGRDVPGRLLSHASTVSAPSLRAHLRFLADDLCEGRGTGARGGTLAARYLAAQLEALGLEPGAPDGTWFQKVPLVGVETDAGGSRLEIAAEGKPPLPLALLEDAVATDETLQESTSVDGEIVFVGHGIFAPDQKWDDFKGSKVDRRVLLVLVNEPQSADEPDLFEGRALTYYGRWTYKYEEAARRGAAGAILVHTDASAGYGWSVVRSSWGRERPYLEPEPGERRLPFAAWITEGKAREALALAGLDFDQLVQRAGRRDFAPVPTGLRLRATLAAKRRPLDTANVVGRLPGAGRREETVVYTAHYDHLGVGLPEGGDAIYNGAVDNGSGCATVLEIARLFAALARPPARSVYFLFPTAEEGGLRGSEFFVAHPPVSLPRIAANLNLDGVAVDGEPTEYFANGYERSTLRGAVERTARGLGVNLVPDPHPEQGFFYRSDHFNFARGHVPAVSISPGLAFAGKPEGWGEERFQDYRKNRYHRPGDEFDPRWDLEGLKKTARFAFVLGALIADDARMPVYVPGDEFAKPGGR
ncbi:MAG TPA: M28 family peptidase [Planctomycetota bacterium]|nr:M28 family peptidase [Planctomycetota bacterium]